MRSCGLLFLLAGCGRLGFDGDSFAERQVLYMPFDGDRVDVVTGSAAGCIGTECPTYTPGVVGEAAAFDGIDDCVHVPWMTSWVPDTFTISAWVHLEAMTAPVVVKNYGAGCPAASLSVANQSVGLVVIDVTDQHEEAWSPQLVLPQTWHALSVQWDGLTQQVFVDGTCACAITPPRRFAFIDNEVTLGCYPDVEALAHGAIDEVRIHDRALSSDEIADLAAAGGATPPTPAACATLCNTFAP